MTPATATSSNGSAVLREVSTTSRDAAASLALDDRDACLPGVHAEELQAPCPQFWTVWKRLQKSAGSRVPVVLFRRRRSKCMICLAAEDLPALSASVRAAQEALA
ncbi:MAG: hypothetical protein IT430_14160 [Phycisphaerales bacterium]|nr:hypothetical protein [Phycisphaerales bacterium]